MPYTVPQFINRESKVIGPLTLRQFFYIAVDAVICYILYIKVPFFIFLMATATLSAVAFALAFVKIGGRDIPSVIASFFNFSVSPKMYLWKRKSAGAIIMEKMEFKEKKEEGPAPAPKIASKSLLSRLSVEVETKKNNLP